MGSCPSVKKGNHTKRSVVIVAFVAGAVAIGVVAELGFVYATYGCFGPCGTVPYISATSCYSVNGTCQLVMAGLTNLPGGRGQDAVSCYFNENSVAAQGNLSSSPNGPPSSVSIPLNASVKAYCSYTGTPSAGHQVTGSVSFSSGNSVPFSSTWQ